MGDYGMDEKDGYENNILIKFSVADMVDFLQAISKISNSLKAIANAIEGCNFFERKY